MSAPSHRPLDVILDDLVAVCDRIGAGEDGLGDLEESLITEMNAHPDNPNGYSYQPKPKTSGLS